MNKGGAQPQAQGGGGGESLDFLWIIVAIIIAVMITWHYGKAYIAQGILVVRFYEIQAIKYFFSYWAYFVTWVMLHWHINLPFPDLTLINTWQRFAVVSKGSVPFSILMSLSSDVGSFLRYPIILFLLILAAILYKTSITQQFKNFFNMRDLRQAEQENWPQIAPIVKLNLLETPLDEGPWAIAMSPMQFCKKHKLLKIENDPTTGRPIATLLKGPAHNLLSMQLGPRWKGVQYLPKYLQALFAVFISRVNGDKKTADALVEQFAASMAKKGKLNLEGVRKVLVKNYNTKEVAKILSIHAYVTTAMASLLSASREAGVLATSEFIWLKPIDRRMWYMLNSVGRPTAVAEISGAFAHWLAERKLGLPLTIPMVDEAVRGLEIALKEIIYKPDEEDESKKKKKKKWF